MRKILSLLMLTTFLVPCMTGCSARAEQRTGQAEGYGGTLKVTVTLNDTDITDVKITEHHETQGVGTRAIDALPKLIEEADSAEVDSVSGATVTSKAIKEAVRQAMGMSAVVQEVIPLDGKDAVQAKELRYLTGAGMAATGRVGPGKAEDGSQVYSVNVVFAAGEFEENGAIRSIQVDQLEIVSPNLGGGSAFSGFPAKTEGEEAFLQEVSAWQTKGDMGDNYMLKSGSWREQMDAYEQLMVGKTVQEVKDWYAKRGSSNATTSETEATDASDAGAVQPVNDMADVPHADVNTSATISLEGEYGDVLLAIERAWEDAQKGRTAPEGTKVDTNTVNDATEGETAAG